MEGCFNSRDDGVPVRPALFVLACLLVGGAGSAANAQDEVGGASDGRQISAPERTHRTPRPARELEPKPAPVFVVEIAQRWLPALVDRPFAMRVPVDVVELGARVLGTSNSRGKYTIRCVEGEGALCFVIDACGTSTAKTRSRRRVVSIHTMAVTQFEASKRIELREGTFVAEDTSVDAMRTRCVRSQIKPHRRIGRRIVVRIARQRMRRKRDEINRVRRRLTEQRIRDAVDRSVEQAGRTVENVVQYVPVLAAWMGWNGNSAPFQLQTGDGFLRLAHYRDDAPGSRVLFVNIPGSNGALRVGIATSVLFHLASRFR